MNFQLLVFFLSWDLEMNKHLSLVIFEIKSKILIILRYNKLKFFIKSTMNNIEINKIYVSNISY